MRSEFDILVSVLCPSRKRLKMFNKSIKSLLSNCDDPGRIEILVRFDFDDKESLSRISEFNLRPQDKIVIGHRYRGYADAHYFFNDLAAVATGQFMFIWNDDTLMESPHWDTIVSKYKHYTFPILKPNIRNMNIPHLNGNPIFTRKLFDITGYVALNSQTDTWISNLSKKSNTEIVENNIVLFNNSYHSANDPESLDDTWREGSCHVLPTTCAELDAKRWIIKDDAVKVINYVKKFQGDEEQQDVRVITNTHIAADSPNTTHPWGTRLDNHSDLTFIEEVEKYFGKKVNFLDIGCAGGQLAVDFFRKGNLSVGLEGSDFNLVHNIFNWPRYMNNKVLHLCDISKPFEIMGKDDHRIKFNCITAWLVLEHIFPDRLDAVFQNVLNHITTDGIFTGLINTISEKPQGVELHLSKFTQNEWIKLFEKYFTVLSYPFQKQVRYDKNSFVFFLKNKEITQILA